MTLCRYCYRWNNAANILCYDCDSCKAGVLEQVRMDWHKLTILNVVVLVFLIAVYSVGCCAFRNARRAEFEYPYGPSRMPKAHPLWDESWYFWLPNSHSIPISIPTCGGRETEEHSSTDNTAFSPLLSCLSGGVQCRL
ncbi:hypothetical protein B296_00026629 [Ensete ventricosum]|uniref:Uncharacterized protein n=1 Tax=Ensete ventricosum TaxID=4639 RepID=A0A427A962_ENSVE|nr:hypothetical protein B296_00026629 [Ensete ventricosum]